jgi:hypothetical protein
VLIRREHYRSLNVLLVNAGDLSQAMNSRDYQERAREAQDKAWAATSEDLRARWLVVAQAWLLMAGEDAERWCRSTGRLLGSDECDAHFAVSLKLGG